MAIQTSIIQIRIPLFTVNYLVGDFLEGFDVSILQVISELFEYFKCFY